MKTESYQICRKECVVPENQVSMDMKTKLQ